MTDGAQTSTPITTSVDIAAASSVAASFSGISDPTNYPPQNALAVGPQSIVTAESSRYEVTNLTGGAATPGSLFSLFSSLGTTLDNSTYDPRAAYDSSTGRFVLIVNNIQPGGSTNIDIAVSNDSNPTDGWSVASLDTSTGGTTQSDMPDLSVTGGNIYLTAPEYPASGFSGTGQWVISESSVVSGSPQVIASQIAPPSDAIMRNISGGNGLTYYVSAFSNGSQSELTYETYSAAAGFSGTQTLALGNNDQGPGGTDYTAQQAGTSLTLDAGNSHIQSLAYANGYLYGVSETLPVGASAPDVHWFKLDVSNPASPQIVAQGDLSGSLLGNANIALFNPSIAVDGNGDVLINFTASGPNMDPSDYYVVQGAKDLAFGAPTLYQASTSYFQQTPGATGAQRWGTYSSAVADPNNPNGFWISNEYVTNTGVTIPSGLSAWWDTAVAQVSVGGSVGGGPVGPPTIAGTHATPTTVDAAVNPFTGVTIGDLNAGATDTLTITLSNSGTTGVLSGTGLSAGTNGVYTLSGTAGAVTSALDLLSFKPATGAPGSVTTTTFCVERSEHRLCDAGDRQRDNGDRHRRGHSDDRGDACDADDGGRGGQSVHGRDDRRSERRRHGHADHHAVEQRDDGRAVGNGSERRDEWRLYAKRHGRSGHQRSGSIVIQAGDGSAGQRHDDDVCVERSEHRLCDAGDRQRDERDRHRPGAAHAADDILRDVYRHRLDGPLEPQRHGDCGHDSHALRRYDGARTHRCRHRGNVDDCYHRERERDPRLYGDRDFPRRNESPLGALL